MRVWFYLRQAPADYVSAFGIAGVRGWPMSSAVTIAVRESPGTSLLCCEVFSTAAVSIRCPGSD